MRRLLLNTTILSTLALTACTVTVNTDSPDSKDQQVNDTLASGAPVVEPPPQVLMPIAGEKTVSYKLWFRVGSQNDPKGKEGLAWMTAEMIGQGGTKARGYSAVVDALYPMAASYYVNTDREMTTLSGRVHVDHLADYEKLLVEAFTQPAFAKEDFERIKAEALNSIEKSLRFAQDEELGKAGLFQFVFEGTPYAHPSVGTVASLQGITIEDIESFYAKHYTQGSLVIGLGGGYEGASVEAIEAGRALLPEGKAVTPPDIAVSSIEGRQLRFVNKPGADASISFGFPIDVHRGDKDYYALWIANSWMGEHRNSASHLFQVIREKRGLNYGDYSYIEVFPNGGRRSMPPTNVARRHQIFEVWIRTLPNKHAHFALRAAVRELDALFEKGMSQEDFELQRAFLKKYSLHFADTTSGRLGYAIDDAFYGLDEPHLKHFRDMMDSLTLEDVNAALAKHMSTKNMKIVISTGEAESLAKAIVDDAPSPMEYSNPKPDEVMEEDKIIATYPLGIDASAVSTVKVENFLQ
jgi:zinc protease